MALSIPKLNAIAKKDPDTHEALRRIVNAINSLSEKTGADAYPSQQQTKGQTVGAPAAPASLEVSVSAGSFFATISPSPGATPSLLYFLEASTDKLFPVEKTIVYSLGNLNTIHSVLDGSKVWYFRARSKYQSSAFSPYTYFGTAANPQGSQTGAVSQFGNLLLKSIGQVVGVTNNPTTTSASPTFVVVPDMSLTLTTRGNKVFISFSCSFHSDTPAGSVFFRVFRDGQPLSNQVQGASPIANQDMTANSSFIDVPAAGSHLYELRWCVTSGTTATATGVARSLQVVELG